MAVPLPRFIAPLALIIALLSAAPATAGLVPKMYGGQTKLGMSTASRSDGGSCSVATGLLADAVLRCGSSGGTARARYLFTPPKHTGSITVQVNFFGSHCGADVHTKRISDTQFRVDVTLADAGRADISSVMIEYYYSKS